MEEKKCFFRGKTTEDFPLRDTVGKNAGIVKFCGVLGVDLKCLKVISPKFEKSAFRGHLPSREKFDCARKKRSDNTVGVGAPTPPEWEAGKNLQKEENSRLFVVASVSRVLQSPAYFAFIYIAFDAAAAAPLTCQSWQKNITSHWCSCWGRNGSPEEDEGNEWPPQSQRSSASREKV